MARTKLVAAGAIGALVMGGFGTLPVAGAAEHGAGTDRLGSSSANEASATAPMPLAFEFVEDWSGPLTGVLVGGFAFAGDTVYGTDVLGSRIFAKTGSDVDFFGSEGVGNNQFDDPLGIAVRGDKLVVTDFGNDRVKLHKRSDLSFDSILYSSGSGASEVDEPTGVAVGPAGDLYVVDAENFRVHHAEPGEAWTRFFGGASYDPEPGQFYRAFGAAVAPDSSLWVTDFQAGHVTKFSAKGVPLTRLSGAKAEPGIVSQPTGIAADSAGRLYVAQFGGSGVKVYSPSGAYLTTIGGSGSPDAELVPPSYGLQVDPRGTVYIGSILGVKVFRPVLAALAAPVVSGSAKVGSTLHASGGSWPVPDVTLAYQWLRDGSSIVGATSSSYKLVTADAGRKVTVRVTASRADYGSSSSATSSQVSVAKLKAKAKVKLAKKTVKVGKRAKVTVRVQVPGIAKPKGTLVIRDGKKKITTVKLKAKHAGKLTVRLPKLKAGKHKITVTFKATKQISKAKSKPKT
ncbi:MAG: hypothetical protein M3Y20_07030, partial [Actinomycetota bacterium]|nr:hypothetical protein [Actinomycetota bacterium]